MASSGIKDTMGSDRQPTISISPFCIWRKIGIISKLPVQVGVYCQLAACDFRNLYRYQLIKGGAGGAFCSRVCGTSSTGSRFPYLEVSISEGGFISSAAPAMLPEDVPLEEGDGGGAGHESLQAVSERAMAPVAIIAIIFSWLSFSFLILNISLLRKQN